MITARVRRSAVSLLAGAALVAAPTVLLLTPASAAGAVITVLSSQGYVDPLDGPVIVGEVQNTGTGTTGLVAIDVTWWSGPNGTGTDLGTDPGATSSTLGRIPTGAPADVANRSPFRALVTPPANYASYTLTATPSDPMGEPNHNFVIAISSHPSDPADSNGLHHVIGTITNTNTTPADNVTIVVTMYDGAGAVVDEAVGFTSGASTTLDAAGTPGAVGHFDLASEGSGRAYARVAAIGESSSAAAPAASPSASPASAAPSASATTASPSPSPTATGTTSPSPSASTTSPSPSASPTAAPPAPACRPGGGAFAIATTPTYAKIVKGGHVRLSAALTQAQRACQSGIRLSVYVRGPGTTLYHVSKTLTTGSTGKAVADYTGVKADFRWYVVSSGARSATGLVQAR